MNQKGLITKSYAISPAAGKRLIARALLQIPSIMDALRNNTIVIAAGTTNAYVAEEFLNVINQSEGFSRKGFFRGITLPHHYIRTDSGNQAEENKFLGDVVIVKGIWERGKTIFDVAEQLQMGDVILKGANAVNLAAKQAAVLIGHPTMGTTNPILQSCVGRRVELYLPVGLEKRVTCNLNELALKLNSPNATGPRLMPVSGNIVTELQAIQLLCSVDAELIAGGGVCGAEGTCWIAVTGTDDQIKKMDELFEEVQGEENFIL
jgi:hypothetical protein